MSLIGGGSIGLTVAQGWILAGVGACFIAWGDIGHELLTHPISLDWSWPNSNATTPSTGSTTATGQPMVITVIDGGANNGGETVITNGDGTGADSGGWSTADQTDLAWTAAIACAAARAKKPGDINYAEGFLSLDGSIPPESYGPIVGYGPQDTHSEQVIVDYWRDTSSHNYILM